MHSCSSSKHIHNSLLFLLCAMSDRNVQPAFFVTLLPIKKKCAQPKLATLIKSPVKKLSAAKRCGANPILFTERRFARLDYHS